MLKHMNSEFEVLAVYGGTSINDQIYKLRNGVDIIVGTPGRTIDLANRGMLKFTNLKVFTLDEADEMLNMGFAEDIERLFEFILTDTTKD